jgi:hypothetical protein
MKVYETLENEPIIWGYRREKTNANKRGKKKHGSLEEERKKTFEGTSLRVKYSK